jgi:hypothetical protein
MQHTASSAQRNGSSQPPPTDARARLLQHTKQTARTRKALARLDDSLWRTMQERTEQPVARPTTIIGQAPQGQWPLTTGGQLQLSLPIRTAAAAGAAEPRTGSTTTATATATTRSPATSSLGESEGMV